MIPIQNIHSTSSNKILNHKNQEITIRKKIEYLLCQIIKNQIIFQEAQEIKVKTKIKERLRK